MSHVALISGDCHAIAVYLIGLYQAELSVDDIARRISSVDALLDLGHQVTRADLIGLARFVCACCGDLGPQAQRLCHVTARFADDDHAAQIVQMTLADLVGVLRPVLGLPACAA